MNTLEETTERLNRVIVMVEEALARRKLGVTSWVPLDAAKWPGRFLGFGKVSGEWRLFFCNEDGSNEALLSQASREARVVAMSGDHLRQLLAALEARAIVETGPVEAACENAEGFVEWLGEKS